MILVYTSKVPNIKERKDIQPKTITTPQELRWWHVVNYNRNTCYFKVWKCPKQINIKLKWPTVKLNIKWYVVLQQAVHLNTHEMTGTRNNMENNNACGFGLECVRWTINGYNDRNMMRRQWVLEEKCRCIFSFSMYIWQNCLNSTIPRFPAGPGEISMCGD